jgi:PAS domain S-box-containing protein
MLAECILLAGLGVTLWWLHRLWRDNVRLRRAVAETEHIEQQSALFVAAVESSPAGVVISDPRQAGNPIIFVNKAFTTITGYSAAEALGQNCRFLQGTHTDTSSIADIKTALAKREPLHVTLLNYRKNQTPFWNDLHIAPLFDASGTLTHFIALQTDVTAMQHTQQALSIAKDQAERATSVKSNFMAMMSHEIRTPINGILGTLSLLNDLPLTGEAQQLAKTAYESADALLAIVNDMLDFSKIEAGKLSLETTEFHLPELLRGCINLMQSIADRKGLRLTLDYADSVPRLVAGDPTRIQQVVLNLISNALKFTETGGVTVRVTNLLATASASGLDSIVRFEVIDTGIGMSPDGLTHIFTEFNQLDPSVARRYGGTGLGLAICRRLIEMMHGEIEVESRVGEGSKFWFVLPLQTSVTPLEQAPASALPHLAPMPQGQHILVVEDNATNQLVLSKMLERGGYQCSIAENGALAVAAVQAQRFDLVFMDVSMPVMDGLTATRAIRALGGAHAVLPIIAMTAQSMQGDRERCLGAGMNDYLSKPIDRDKLYRVTAQWLQTTPPETSNTANTSGAALTALPVLDTAILAQMHEDIGAEAVARLLVIFADDMTRRMESVQAAYPLADWAALQHEAHTLKSSAASCGLLQFSEQLRRLETALSSGDTATACQLHPVLTTQAAAAAQALAAYTNGSNS